MSKKRGLGKGLQALIPLAAEDAAEKEQLREIEIEKIKPAPRQARHIFDQEKLEELAASIKEHGVIQPVVVRPLAEGGYELIAGERRWRASMKVGLNTIPAVVKDYRDLEATAVSLIENIQREDLNPLEEAQAYRQLMEEFGLTQEEVSGRVGKSRSLVANMVRLLDLPSEVREMLSSGLLSAGHARALLAIKDSKKQLTAAGRIARQQLNVRQAERIARALAEEKVKESRKKAARKEQLRRIEEILAGLFEAQVKIKENPEGGGKLEIKFTSENELRRILELIGAAER